MIKIESVLDRRNMSKAQVKERIRSAETKKLLSSRTGKPTFAYYISIYICSLTKSLEWVSPEKIRTWMRVVSRELADFDTLGIRL